MNTVLGLLFLNLSFISIIISFFMVASETDEQE